jgi:hypothetical protein
MSTADANTMSLPPRTLWRRPATWICGLLAVVLTAAFGLQFFYLLRETPQPKQRERLKVLVPTEAGEWRSHEEPLGATETINEAVLKTLNLDDYVYRRFTSGARNFTVYAAYWAAGRMPTRLVASHTPDRCWTENGMRCVAMRFHEVLRVGGKPLLPTEYREFVVPAVGRSTYVAYWHTVEGKLYDYGGRFNAIPDPWLWWKDAVQQAMLGSREQLFVRIASETPLEELWADKDFQALMAKVADLGLWAPP